jgi:hypothetical protein
MTDFSSTETVYQPVTRNSVIHPDRQRALVQQLRGIAGITGHEPSTGAPDIQRVHLENEHAADGRRLRHIIATLGNGDEIRLSFSRHLDGKRFYHGQRVVRQHQLWSVMGDDAQWQSAPVGPLGAVALDSASTIRVGNAMRAIESLLEGNGPPSPSQPFTPGR